MKYLRQFLLAIALLLVGTGHAQTCVTTEAVTTCHYNIPDDGHAIVPIPFGFPFYGHVFTHSIFFDNGAVSFYSPTMPQRWGPSWPGGLTINQTTPSSFFYSIIPLGTDLIANGGTHFTQGNENFFTYNWNNVSQFGRWDSRNTFSVEIHPTGYIGLQYDQIDIQGGWVSGIIGNASLGEFTTFNSTTSWSVNETVPTDCSNPLVNVNCPGYQQALLYQQCSISALYSPACPGYVEALLVQQCSISALYSPACPGYAAAYLEYQCSLNVLYSSTCVGYAEAYFDQQCNLDPLYNELCTGYDDAFYVQQCNLDPLYDSGCTGYAEAFAKKYILVEPAVVIAAVTPELESIVETAVVETSIATADPADKTAVVQLTTEPAATVSVTAPVEAPKTDSAAAPAPKTTRQAVAERRLAAARAQAESRARDNPAETAAALDSAESMEQQAEVQNVVIGAIGFVPGFDAYSRATLPDAAGYRPFAIYPGQRNIDTPAARGLLGRSDRLHQEMVDAQYQ